MVNNDNPQDKLSFWEKHQVKRKKKLDEREMEKQTKLEERLVRKELTQAQKEEKKKQTLLMRQKVKEMDRKGKWKYYREKSSDAVIKAGSAVGNNRFLVAIRDTFMIPFTLTTGAAIPLILSNMFFTKTSMISAIPGVAESEGMYWVDQIIGQPLGNIFWAVMAGFSIYIALGMGYFLAKSYGKDGIIAAGVGIAIFFALKPLEPIAVLNGADGETVMTNYLGNNGMLIALLGSMLGTYIYVKLLDVRWLVPKLPESVPPMVAKAFGSIFAAAITLSIFAFLAQIWFIIATQANLSGEVASSAVNSTTGKIETTIQTRQLSTLFVALEFALAKPLMALGQNIGTTVLISFLVAFLWFFGIHGTNILTPVTSIIWDLNVLRNTEYWEKWKDLNASNPGLYNDYWTDVISVSGTDQQGLMTIPMAGLGYVGGTGATLGFLIGILLFSKYKLHKEIAKLAIVPGIFGINEPICFWIYANLYNWSCLNSYSLNPARSCLNPKYAVWN